MLSSTVRQMCRQCRHRFIGLPLRYPYAVLCRPSQEDVPRPCSWLMTTSVRDAGHSHWQNVKKTKAAKDSEMQRTTHTVLRRIRVAVYESGGTDPKLNRQLARALEEGKLNKVPNATMFEALRKMEKSKNLKGSVIYIEAKALMNCPLIVEAYTDKPKRARQAVQSVLKKYGGSVGESGTARNFYHFKGVVYMCNEGDKSLSKDEALEKAIDSGAEDVVDGVDDEDKPALKFICDTKELHVVKKALDDSGLETTAARFEFIPHTFVTLEGVALDAAANMIETLEQLDEVVRVFDNIQAADTGT